jgi:hypothetical protein
LPFPWYLVLVCNNYSSVLLCYLHHIVVELQSISAPFFSFLYLSFFEVRYLIWYSIH